MEPRRVKTDAELAQEAEALEALLKMPGWARLRAIAEEKAAANREALLNVNPTDAAEIARLQAEARNALALFALAEERIRKGREARDRIIRRENDRAYRG